MKIVFKIFGILGVLGVLFLGLMIGLRMSNELSSLEDAGVFGDMAGKMLGIDKGSLSTGMIMGFISMIMGIVGMVAMFVKAKTFRLGVAGLLAVVGILTFILVPSIDAGSMGPVNPATLSMILMIDALIAAGCLFGLNSINAKASAA